MPVNKINNPKLMPSDAQMSGKFVVEIELELKSNFDLLNYNRGFEYSRV